MIKRKLYLHIGMEKTGSTSIQESLFINRENLLRQGIATLDCCGLKNSRKFSLYALEQGTFDDFFIENSILTEAQRRTFDRTIEDDLQLEISCLPENIHTVIISSEHLHSRLKKITEISRLYTFLTKYFENIEVLCYVREQSLVAVSWYSTIIKSGNIRHKNRVPNFYEYLEIWCKKENHYFNYIRILEKWSSVFGKNRVNVRLFDKSAFYKSNLLDDFYKLAGEPYTENFIRLSPKNESLSNFGLLLGRIVNDIFPRFTPYSGIRYRLINLIEFLYRGSPKLIDKKMYDTVYNHFLDENKKLSIEYFGVNENVFEYKPPEQG
ncbi:hypothetical protein [Alteromonas sp.]|uniref:hypothetical protein n=1 Tax=Alteromonas sp. TaxID=232 RepID=UPI00258116F7|nr:hypothetical protein [Alteromonas sp.]NQY17007.1 hypothetical protein [Alteromonas sp.]